MAQEDLKGLGKHLAEEGVTETGFERLEGRTRKKLGRGPELKQMGNKDKTKMKEARCALRKAGKGRTM